MYQARGLTILRLCKENEHKDYAKVVGELFDTVYDRRRTRRSNIFIKILENGHDALLCQFYMQKFPLEYEVLYDWLSEGQDDRFFQRFNVGWYKS